MSVLSTTMMQYNIEISCMYCMQLDMTCLWPRRFNKAYFCRCNFATPQVTCVFGQLLFRSDNGKIPSHIAEFHMGRVPHPKNAKQVLPIIQLLQERSDAHLLNAERLLQGLAAMLQQQKQDKGCQADTYWAFMATYRV